jgi:hypothetical protein
MPGEPRPLPHIEIPEWILALMGLGGDDGPEPDPPIVQPDPVPPPQPEPPPEPVPAPPVAPPPAGQEEVFGLPVDPAAVAAAELVRDILNDAEIFQPGGEAAGSAAVITVLTHPDGTITIGVSGHPNGARNAEAVLRGDARLPAGARIGPADVVLPDGVNRKPCAEVRAALGAQMPDDDGNVRPPPTGMGTIARDPEGPAGRFEDPANPGTLCPCGTCAARAPVLRPLIGVPPAPAPGG